MRSEKHLMLFAFLLFAGSFTILQAQSLVNRLLTPVYITSSMMFGYDSNVLKLSENEIETTGENLWILGDMDTFDSGMIRPALKIEYSPVIFSDHETRFTVDTRYTYYSQSQKKTYSSASVKMETHLWKYTWLKLGYSIQPDVYLRTFVDRDRINQDPFTCTFANETVWSSISFPIVRETWITGKVKQNNQYYNTSFTEFDIEKIGAEGRITSVYFRPFHLSIFYANAEGENTSYNSGYISTTFDRSYLERSFGGYVKLHCKKWINSITQSIAVSQRFYQSEDSDDPIHSGREQEEILYRIFLKKEFQSGFALELNGNYRSRTTFSEFDWVEDLKSFSKFDFGITISNNTILDLFY